ARDFVAARSWGALGTCAMAALVNYLQGMGDSRTPMLTGILGNVVNVVLAYSLIHGRLGLPALGVRGAGYATAATEMMELVLLSAAVHARARREGRAAIQLRPALREVAGVGVPTGFQFVMENLAFTTFTALLG